MNRLPRKQSKPSDTSTSTLNGAQPVKNGTLREIAPLDRIKSHASQAERKAKVLEAISEGYKIRASAELAGVCKNTVFNWRNDDQEFQKAYDKAMLASCSNLEDLMQDHAHVEWKACQALLRTRDPSRWLWQNRHDINVGVVLEVGIRDEITSRIRRIVAAEQGSELVGRDERPRDAAHEVRLANMGPTRAIAPRR